MLAEATEAELSQPVTLTLTAPQTIYLPLELFQAGWQEHNGTRLSQQGLHTPLCCRGPSWGSQGCSTRLVKMEQQRLLASAQSSTATCVMAEASTLFWQEQRALPALDAGSGVAPEEQKRGRGSMGETGYQSPREQGSLSPHIAKLSSVNKFRNALIECKRRRSITGWSSIYLKKENVLRSWMNSHCEETLRVFKQFHQNRKDNFRSESAGSSLDL